MKSGEMQAESPVKKVPKGNYFLMGGSPVDNNARLFRAGQMKVLKPYIDNGSIKIVGDQWVDAAAGKRAENYGKCPDRQ